MAVSTAGSDRGEQLPLGPNTALSDDELRHLFPWPVRPAVFRVLWLVLAVLIVVLVLLAVQYGRVTGW